ncbi:hypothetical protein A2841_04105 [Candidatus Kaiserbacteria bacterium RIFCSPHIGHO2_01_FULL_48_10]|uniref:Ig-like domain-containing protein n=1 Tax=Candidatus Kaiserbacteria bacterium RIFCSPHIGHO2_01_FULL_48_10 TaxID=1798476 RepID=A0A1F6C5G3_9BACT|nr:MAG: hypothetical protein A2841_04105 [Candidatus Kaiserbacteria bacterium RIFCSPHIGHO2_01_FULL_48_10]
MSYTTPKKVSLTVIVGFLLMSSLAQAQVAGFDSIEIVASPGNPRAGQQVLLRVQSVSIDLDRATISWTVNGKRAASGVGVKNTTATAGALGSRLQVGVEITASSGDRFSENLTISVSSVDVLWQAVSYVPPLYRGKTLPAAEAPLLVAAIPHLIGNSGKEAAPGTLIYTWRRGTTVLGNQSGRGKNTVLVDGPKLNDSVRVSVEVATADGTVTGSGATVITAATPRIVFYEDSPLLGIRFEEALQKQFALKTAETRIVSIPYFMSVGRKSDTATLRYQWSLNGSAVNSEEGGNAGSITLRQVTEDTGTATLALSIQNLKRILQSASANLTIFFGSGN